LTGTFDEEFRAIQAMLSKDDPRFVEGIRQGQPCAPVEYRRRRWWWLVGASVFVVLAGILVNQVVLMVVGFIALVGASQRPS
jgi:hypothetical protein